MITRRRCRVLALLLCAMWVGSAAWAQSNTAGVPVTVTKVDLRDVPVVLKTIGTVQAFQSVGVRARVDGTLDKVLFTEGQHVKPGDLLAQLDARPYQALLAQAFARKAADEATLASAQADLTRYSELASQQIASRQRFEQAKAAVGQADANVHGDDASIMTAQLNVNFTQITSPIEGRVGLRQVDAGNYIRSADTNAPVIVTITQIQPIALVFTLPQDELPEIHTAMRGGALPVAAYAADDKTLLSRGQLLTIDSAIDTTTGTIKLKAVFGNEDEALWPGQFVNVQLQIGKRLSVPTVPSEVVQRGPDGLYVYVVKPDQSVVRQTITLTEDDGQTAVIQSGLVGGETVVLAGQSRLTDGNHVAASPAKSAG